MVIEGATASDILTSPGNWASEVERVPSLHLVDKMQRAIPATCGTRTAVYAIGDIHDRSDLLDTMFDAIAADAAHRGVRAQIVLTGDNVDKGPDSHGVVERIMAGPPRGAHELLCLRGNHHDMFRKVVAGTPGLPNWAWELHEHAVRSYGRDSPARSALLRRHADFLASLPLTFDDGLNLFVHAGIRPGVPLSRQREEDLLWIREGFLDYEGPCPGASCTAIRSSATIRWLPLTGSRSTPGPTGQGS